MTKNQARELWKTTRDELNAQIDDFTGQRGNGIGFSKRQAADIKAGIFDGTRCMLAALMNAGVFSDDEV